MWTLLSWLSVLQQQFVWTVIFSVFTVQSSFLLQTKNFKHDGGKSSLPLHATKEGKIHFTFPLAGSDTGNKLPASEHIVDKSLLFGSDNDQTLEHLLHILFSGTWIHEVFRKLFNWGHKAKLSSIHLSHSWLWLDWSLFQQPQSERSAQFLG